jgi:hypothetical protein
VGVKHPALYEQLLGIARAWDVRTLVCDATGVGAGLTAFLGRALGGKVIPFTFSSRSKSDLGWAFLALVDAGRLKDYRADQPGTLLDLQKEYFQQLAACQYQIQTGPDKKIRWSVPDGIRDPASGELVHDDLLISAAMLALLDEQTWSLSGPAVVVDAQDPLDDMKGF